MRDRRSLQNVRRNAAGDTLHRPMDRVARRMVVARRRLYVAWPGSIRSPAGFRRRRSAITGPTIDRSARTAPCSACNSSTPNTTRGERPVDRFQRTARIATAFSRIVSRMVLWSAIHRACRLHRNSVHRPRRSIGRSGRRSGADATCWRQGTTPPENRLCIFSVVEWGASGTGRSRGRFGNLTMGKKKAPPDGRRAVTSSTWFFPPTGRRAAKRKRCGSGSAGRSRRAVR